jgi:hypothetical protein
MYLGTHVHLTGVFKHMLYISANEHQWLRCAYDLVFQRHEITSADNLRSAPDLISNRLD